MPAYDRDDVLARVDLAELATELCGPPAGRGRSARWHCPNPDHPDRHPSMTIFEGSRSPRWKCQACGEGGTAIDLWMLTHGCPVGPAIAALAERAGKAPRRLDVPSFGQPARHLARSAMPIDLAPEPDAVDVRVQAYVADTEAILWTARGEGARHWLSARGFEEDVLRANRVGYDPGPADLRRPAGLPRRGVGVVFPVLGSRGQPAWFQTRYLDPAGAGRKYDNPVAEVAANPHVAIVRTRLAAPAENVVVTEGIPDALAAAHFAARVAAVVGAANYGEHVAARLEAAAARGAGFVFVLDGDEPGRNGGSQLAAHLAARGRSVVVLAPPPPHKDLNEWWLGDRPAVEAALSAAAEPSLHAQVVQAPVRGDEMAAGL